MQSYLKTETLDSEVLKLSFAARELHAGGQAQIRDAKADGKDSVYIAALTCKLCIIPWHEELVEDIANELSLDALSELAKKCLVLSGVDLTADDIADDLDVSLSKNSDAGQDADSS